MKKRSFKHSIIDDLFYDLFQFYPSKEGKSYELLVGAVLKILNPTDKVEWNKWMIGEFDKNKYQIDVSLFSIESSKIVAVETKDHTKYECKVDRKVIDKLAGTLIEIESTAGYVFSATDYTADAMRKSDGSKINPGAKDIDLYHLRPSTDDDNLGRLKMLTARISLVLPDLVNSTFEPTVEDSFFDKLAQSNINYNDFQQIKTNLQYEKGKVKIEGDIFDANQKKIGYLKVEKLFAKNILIDAREQDRKSADGIVDVDFGEISILGIKGKVDKLKYSIGLEIIEDMELQVKSIGIPKLLVKTQDNSINKLITDHQLKGITFENNGEIKFDGRQA